MDKAPDAFRTISEVADELDVPQHVLRFWESRFSQIRPMKRAGGRRYYRADDVDLLRGIRQLLYGEGYTIRGVQRILKEHGVKFVQTVWQEGAEQPARLPDDDMAEEAAEPAGAEAASPRGLRGLLPSLHSKEMERREPRLDDAAGRAETDSNLPGPDGVNTSAAKLGQEDLRKLQAVLHELSECRRLLDDVLR
ncbi:MAG TPA: MerR family transcriptional regulator [Xanthobacteraceae bacterium]|nr:MerR family transcriptional regulator [Xanthobacteraceae bacterium]